MVLPLPSSAPETVLLAERLFDQLRVGSFDGVGITRASYGASESRAMSLLKDVAIECGLEVDTDRAGNLLISLVGEEPDLPKVACGSHLDSVPEGGNYDGAAGVVAGLLALAHCKRNAIVPARTLQVMALRGEESAWFGQAYLGSKALFGMLSEADLARPQRETGKPLGDYMLDAGADLAAISAGESLLDPADLACYLELHIEQGPVMVARNVELGVVTGIRGNHRHASITCTGEAAHSGAVPRWLRRDAVFAVSEFIMRIDRHWQALLEQGQDLVVTVGILNTNASEHAMSRVPGEVTFALEYRSESRELLADFEALARSEAAGIERLRGVEFDFSDSIFAEPAIMTETLVDLLDSVCSELSVSHERIPSGAGHDAAVFANQGIPTGMLFVRNEDGSHNPYEKMDMADFIHGVDALTMAMLRVPEALL